jgi:hypothetical protein
MDSRCPEHRAVAIQQLGGDPVMNLGLYLVTAAVFILMGWMHYRHRNAVKAERAAMFNGCLEMFKAPLVVQDDVNFPVLTGNYRGYEVKLEPIADHVAFRKLPSLWMLITIKAEVPYRGIFDFLMRPQNLEFFSPSSQLEERIEIPKDWPQYAIIRTNRAGEMPPMDKLSKHMGLFEDSKAKELLVTPRGVRIVYQANQAEQRNYRVTRSMAFDSLSLNQELLSSLIDRAIAIHQDLAEEAVHEYTSQQVADHGQYQSV